MRCGMCQGAGYIYGRVRCPRCEGTGVDTDTARDLRFTPLNDRTWGPGEWVRCPTCPRDREGREAYHHRDAHRQLCPECHGTGYIHEGMGAWVSCSCSAGRPVGTVPTTHPSTTGVQ